ncbi:MAG TPA: hypothetical protein VEC16_00900 [Alphaproteobacteria bacterium]|nr:hypothetical protein [Alphaproteobacteria bacterium]
MKKIVYAILFMLLALTLTTAVSAAPSFTANDLEFGSENQQTGQDATATLTLTNTGDANLTLGLTSGLPAQYNVRFSQSSVTLNVGQTATVTVTVFIPADQDSGRSEVLSGITVASVTPAVSDNVRTFIETESMLEITKVTIEYDGDEHTLDEDETYDDEDLKAGTSGTLTVYVRNNFDISMDIEDIEVEVDADDLDIDDSDDMGDLEDGDKDSISFDFEIPSDADDGDDFDVDVEVTGRDEDGNLHRDTYTASIEITQESHQISVVSVRFTPQSLTCSGEATLNVEVENTGKSNEDNVQLTIESFALDIEEEFALGDLDEDDNARKSFKFDVDRTVDAGEYDFVITTYYDVDEQSETEVATFSVLPCTSTGTNTGSTGSNTNTNTGSTGTNTNTVPPIVVTNTGSQQAPTYGTASFTDSPAYVAILVAGVLVVAAILIILLVKFVF